MGNIKVKVSVTDVKIEMVHERSSCLRVFLEQTGRGSGWGVWAVGGLNR